MQLQHPRHQYSSTDAFRFGETMDYKMYDPVYEYKQLHVDLRELQMPLCILQLDPADRAVLRIADERDAVQKKTFTKWVNKHLKKVKLEIKELYEDLRDGNGLLSLLEVLSGETLPRERGHMRFHRLQNVQIVLDFLRYRGIKIVNIRADEIVDGNPKLTLGLIWTIILHFQISDVVVPGQADDLSARDALLLWSRRTVEGYPDLKIRDFTDSWRDGRAFLSIIHRHRPDLVDFRTVRHQTTKENLDMAFDIAEKELGVTRLLEAEDVDVASPDEKSLLTYVSSLYDVFPAVPTLEQSIQDNEQQLKWEEYNDVASSFLNWVRHSTDFMLDRNFPNTLPELRALLKEFNRFRSDDVPRRLQDKSHLEELFHELQGLSNNGKFPIDDKLHLDNILRLWQRFTLAQQEKEMALQAEIAKLERLQRLAEKLLRDANGSEDRLNEIERKLRDLESNVEHLHPVDAKRACDPIDYALRSEEMTLRNLFSDAQILREGRFHNGEQMYQRVNQLHQTWMTLKARLHNDLYNRLTTRSFVQEGTTVTRRREVVTEVRLVETNPAFKNIQECIDWVQGKQVSLDNFEFGNDLQSVQTNIEAHTRLHREIVDFQRKIDRCMADKRTLSQEEQKIYMQMLNKLETSYAHLMATSSRVLKSLESLLEFIQAATKELMWLNDKEESEISRDWTSKNLQISEIEKYYEFNKQLTQEYQSLMSDLENREVQFNAVQDQGESMVMDRHPAAKTIEAYMAAMQTQWSWLLQLTMCLETHLKHATAYHHFFGEATDCEKWMRKQSDWLNSQFSRAEISLDEGERLIREMQELREALNNYQSTVENLVSRSHEIVPMKLRRQRMLAPIKTTSLCSYKQLNMSISKNEHCILLDNSQNIKWQIRNSSGQEGLVPAVCLLIPPPNQEAIALADRLRAQFEQLVSLWRSRQRQLKQMMIFATIKVVKNWDLTQFMALDPAQREAIIRALNQDAEKLMSEYAANNQTYEHDRLSREMDECNRIFRELSERAQLEEQMARGPPKQMLAQLEQFKQAMKQLEQGLTERQKEAIPRDLDELNQKVQAHKEFEKLIQSHEPLLESIQQHFNTQKVRHPDTETLHQQAIDRWDRLWSMSHLYVERLKAMEILLNGIDEATDLVTDYENTLLAQECMTSDPESLRQSISEYQELQSSLAPHQSLFDQLKEDLVAVHKFLEHGRPGEVNHPDLDRVNKDVQQLHKRWQKIHNQIADRIRTSESISQLLSDYHTTMRVEKHWSSQMENKVYMQPRVKDDLSPSELQRLLESTMKLYTTLYEQKPQIEKVNHSGSKFVAEAHVFDNHLKKYKKVLEEVHPVDIQKSKRARTQSGVERVENELDMLNRTYTDMITATNDRIRRIKDLLERAGRTVQLPKLLEDDIPQITSYRDLLSKRHLPSSESEEGMDFSDHDSLISPLSPRRDPLIDSTIGEVSEPLQHSPTKTEAPAYDSLRRKQPGRSEHYSLSMNTEGNISGMQTIESRSAFSSVSSTVTRPIAPPDYSSVASISQTSDFLRRADARPPISTTDNRLSARSAVQTVVTSKHEKLKYSTSPIDHAGITDFQKGKAMNLKQALQNGFLDLQNERFMDPNTGKYIPLSEAVQKGYIDDQLVKELNRDIGLKDPNTGQTLSLLEAIQKGLYNPVSECVTDPRTGKTLSVQDAARRGLISQDAASRLSPPVTTTSSTTESRAYYGLPDIQSAVPSGFGISEVIEKGLYDEATGKFIDPITHEKLTLGEAIDRGLIDPNSREIYNPLTNQRITIADGIAQGIIDSDTGQFIDRRQNRRMSLFDALKEKNIDKPASLHDALTEGLIDEKGKITEARSAQKYSLQEAISNGLLDIDTKCIIDSRSGEVLSLAEAVDRGLIDGSGQFVDSRSGRRVSLQQAVSEGKMKVVKRDICFAQTGIHDPSTGDRLSLPEAIQRGVIDPNTGIYCDRKTGEKIKMDEAMKRGYIDANLGGKLLSDSGLHDTRGQPVSVIGAITKGYLDPETGRISDPETGRAMTLQDAASLNYISSEKAQMMMEVTSPMMATTTITSKVEPAERALEIGTVDIHGSQTSKAHAPNTLTFPEAQKLGLIDSRSGTFLDTKSGTLLPVEKAISQGLVTPEWVGKPRMEDHPEEMQPPPSFRHVKPGERVTVERKLSESQQITLAHAIDQGLLSQTTGFYRDPNTGVRMPLEQAISRGLINPESASFTDPQTGDTVDLQEAIERGLLGATGQVPSPDRATRTSLKEALETGVLKTYAPGEGPSLRKPPPVPLKPTRTVIFEQKHLDVQAYRDPATGKELTVEEAESKGLIDTKSGTCVDPHTGETIPISEGVRRGLIKAQEVSSVSKVATVNESKAFTITGAIDPQTGEELNVSEAVKAGIIDQKSGSYVTHDSLGKKVHIPLEEAIRQELVITKVAPEPPTEGETKTLKIESVIDPKSGQELSINEAINRGIIDHKTGSYIDQNTGKKIPISEAVSKGLVKGEVTTPKPLPKGVLSQSEIKVIAKSVIDPKTGNEVPISEAVAKGWIDATTGVYTNPISGEQMALKEAIDKGLVKSSESSDGLTKTLSIKTVVDPKTGYDVNITDAIKKGIIDPKSGTYNDTVSGESIPISDAVSKGIVKAEFAAPKPLPPGVSSESDLTASKEVKLAVKSVIDPRSGNEIPVDDAIAEGLVDLTSGLFINPSSGERLRLTEAIDRGFVKTHPVADTMESAGRKAITSIHIEDDEIPFSEIKEEDMSEETRKFDITGVIDPTTMKIVSLDEAVQLGIVDQERGIYRNPTTGQTLPISEALQNGLIHGELTSQKMEQAKVRSVFEASPSIRSSTKETDFHQEYQTSNDPSVEIIKSPPPSERHRTGSIHFDSDRPLIKTEEAFKEESSELKISEVTDPRTGIKIDFETAVDEGIIDQERGLFLNPVTGEEVPISVAMNKGFIDAQVTLTGVEESVVVSNGSDARLAPDHPDLTPPDQGTNQKDSDAALLAEPHFDKRPAVDQEHPNVISFEQAMQLGLVDTDAGLFRDPSTGKSIPLAQAISQGLLDVKAPALTDLNTGDTFSLQDAIHKKLIDPKSGKLNQFRAQSMNLNIADEFKPGSAEQKAMNVEDAVKCNLLDPISGKFTDPQSGRIMDLKDAVDQGFIDGKSVVIEDPTSGNKMFLDEAIDQGVIDGTTGLFLDEKGQPMFTLADAMASDMVESTFDPSTGFIVDRKSGNKISLEEAITDKDKVGDQVKVYDTKTGRQIPLNEAEKKGIIDSGQYVDKTTGKTMSIGKAAGLGLLAVVGAPVLLPAMAGKLIYDKVKEVKEKKKEPAVNEKPRVANGDEKFVLDPFEVKQSLHSEPVEQKNETDFLQSNIEETVYTNQSWQTTKTMEIDVIPASAAISATRPGFDKARQSSVESEAAPKVAKIDVLDSHKQDIQKMELEGHQTPISLQEAMDSGLVDSGSGTFTDPVTGEVMSLKSALQEGRVTGFGGKPLSPGKSPKDVKDALQSLIYKDSKKPLSFTQAVDHGLIDLDDNSYTDPLSGQKMTVAEAIRKNLIDSQSDLKALPEEVTGPMTLYDVLSQNLLDPDTGIMIDPYTGQRLSIQEAIDSGVLDNSSTLYDTDSGRLMTLQEAIDAGKIDGKIGEFIDTNTGNRMSLQDAMKHGLMAVFGAPVIGSEGTDDDMEMRFRKLHPGFDPTLVHPVNPESSVTFESAIVCQFPEDDILEITSIFKYTSEEDTIPPSGLPIFKAINDGLLDMISGKYIDPKRKHSLSLEEAIKTGILDPASAAFVEPQTGTRINIREAIEKKLVDPRGYCVDPKTKRKINMQQAIKRGLIKRVKTPELPRKRITVVKEITRIKVVSVIDPVSGRNISLVEALDDKVIDQSSGSYVNPKTGEQTPVDIAVERGLIKGYVVGTRKDKEEYVTVEKSNLVVETSSKELVQHVSRGQSPHAKAAGGKVLKIPKREKIYH
ncbi:uncharacterized protein LOC141899052 [Tubulanus polymorphus]|uniref:uncharacterized protein LOC141899052 n=1 Tax=Tubulanus polymorphus TaxID=672921 RepID=UPI003DA6658E